MITAEKSKESVTTGKTGKVLPARGNAQGGQAPVNGERGSQAHEEDGSQATTLTGESVASLLKSDLAPIVEDFEAERAQTRSDDEEPQQSDEGREEEKAEGQRLKAKVEEEPRKNTENAEGQNAEALKEVNAWKEYIAEREAKLENAEADSEEAKALEQELSDARKELEGWEKVANGDNVEVVPTVPEALQNAINEWQEKGGGELPPELQQLVERKINKVTAQRESIRTEKEALETKVSELEQQLTDARANGENAAGPFLDPRQLDKLEKHAKDAIFEIEAVLDGTATAEEAKRVAGLIGSKQLDSGEQLTAETVRALKQEKRNLTEGLAGLPAERQRIQHFRQAEAQATAKAKEWFPNLFNRSHADYQEAQAVLQANPALRQATPAWQVALGTYILGLKQLRKLHPEADPSANRTGQVPRRASQLPRKAPPKSPTSGGGAAAPQGAKTRAREAEETAARTAHQKQPTSATVTRLLKASLRT